MVAIAASAWAQVPDARLPRFEDYPVKELWQGTPPSLKLTTPSERMFRTNLTNAAKEPASFAGHYRVTYWGCGSNCSAGALIDLQTGNVFPPPLAKPGGSGWERWIECTACFEGANNEFHADSRLMIVRCGLNFSERLQKNIPDTYYFLWEENRFRQLLYVSGKVPEKPSAAPPGHEDATSSWQTFANRAGWSIKYPRTWKTGSCRQCEDPADPDVFVTISDPLANEMVMIEHLVDQPANQTVDAWLHDVARTTVANPQVSEEWTSVGGTKALKVVNRNPDSTESENIYVVRGSRTFAIRMPSNALCQQILSTFRFTTSK
jgi:hypothetical protein